MTGISFSFDPDWMYTLSAPFMTNAFLAGLCISLAAGVMGYFTIARHSTFAAHALAHIGLPGATGAVLLGLCWLLWRFKTPADCLPTPENIARLEALDRTRLNFYYQ